MQEFAFELALCAHLEATGQGVISRQLGAAVHGSRVMDIVRIEPGPEFDDRRAITGETIPAAAIESEVGVGTARYWPDVYEGHSSHEEAIREAALECGFFERERRGGRTYVRQAVRYPDWYGTVVGIENKPDLSRPGALETQLLTDVKLGLLDQVVLATNSHVTGAHRNRIPDPVGIWRFDPETGEREIIREPRQLPVSKPGVEIIERTSVRTEIEIVTPAEIERQRRRIAERAYGKGWRSYELPGCSRIAPDENGLPHCQWNGRLVNPAIECEPACEGFDAASPPDVDLEAIRAERSPWRADPDGRRRTQSDLDQFR